MSLIPVHKPKAQKRFLLSFFFVVPDPVNDLNLVQITSGKNVISKISISEDHIIQNLTLRTRQEVKMPLIFIAFG